MPMTLEARLDALHARARKNPILQRLAPITRLLFAVAFIPTSLVKVLGHRFTTVGVDTPIGFFFEALYRSGGYWRFIGAMQLLAGVLVLFPRTATIGAVIFFPIILNIFVITIALHFTGTPFITGPMLLGCVFLLCWDYDRLKPLLWFPRRQSMPSLDEIGLLERVGYAIGLAGALGVFSTMRGFGGHTLLSVSLITALLGAVVVSAAWIRVAKATRGSR
jgi:hypothetical protein